MQCFRFAQSYRLIAITALMVLVLISLPLQSIQAWNNGRPADLVLGQPDFTTSAGPSTANRMAYPSSIAVDPITGAIFVADQSNSRVLRFASPASLTNGANADGVLGQADFTSKTPTTSQNGMAFPSGVAVDSAGRLWVADSSNNRVLRFDDAASKVNGANADGVLGQPDFSGKAAATTQSGMSSPNALVVDSAGSLWVADWNNYRVLRFNAAASKANGTNADGVLGQPDFSSHRSGTSAQSIAFPAGVAVNSAGAVWISDYSNNRILRFDNAAMKPDGAAADAVLGQPNFTQKTDAQTQKGLYLPSGLSVDAAGNLWVADLNNSRILRFTNAASKLNGANADAVLGQDTFTTNLDRTVIDGMWFPGGVAIDSSGNLWVADTHNHRILRFNAVASKSNGANADAVLGQFDFTTSLPTLQNSLSFPESVAVDPTTGKVFVADQNNNRVLRFASVRALQNYANAEAVLGQPDFTSKGAALTAQGMNYPEGITVDSVGRLWVADFRNRRVLRFDKAASKANGAAADGVLGQPNFTSGYDGLGPASTKAVRDVVVDNVGTLWVVDTYNERVLRFDKAASKVNGAAADAVLGQPSFYSMVAATTQTGMNFPIRIAVDNSGRVWVADGFNHRVLRFDNASRKANGAAADGVLGQPDFISSNAATSANGMSFPGGVAVDMAGRLWLSDSGNARILSFDNASRKANGAAADGVLGQSDFTTGTASTSISGLSNPHDVSVDNAGNVWIADTSNNRVLLFGGFEIRFEIFLPGISKGP